MMNGQKNLNESRTSEPRGYLDAVWFNSLVLQMGKPMS